ncbi:MAG: PDZ domain-containing protein [Armatimonadota bacterium]
MLRITSIFTGFAIVVPLIACGHVVAAPKSDIANIAPSIAKAIGSVRPALVRIVVVSREPSQGREVKSMASGSGAIISADGYVVTNHHVIEGATYITCTLTDRTEVEAKLIGTDPLADIAVVKLKARKAPYPFARWGDSDKVKVGDQVYAMGSPLAISQSVTRGIISNSEMILPKMMGDSLTLSGEDVGSYVRWLGHDALILPGNSGGPLVDNNGTIIGINEISIGLKGAIPSNIARMVAAQLIKYGRVSRGSIGITFQPLLRDSGISQGALVSAVRADSPAAKAGIVPGDVVTKISGQKVTAQFDEDIPIINQHVAALKPGSVVAVDILRAGKNQQLKVNVIQRPSADPGFKALSLLGVTVQDITASVMKDYGLKSKKGVVITGVLPSGAAGSARPALRPGDVITTLDGKPVTNVAVLEALSAEIVKTKGIGVASLVEYTNDEKQQLTVVKLGEENNTSVGEETPKAWLGVETQVLTRQLADALKLSGKSGVRVTRVYKGTTAETAGLKIGDVLIKMAGRTINARQVGDENIFPSMVRQMDIDSETSIELVRGEENKTVNVKLQLAPKSSNEYPTLRDDVLEIVVRDITGMERIEAENKQGEGVKVISVTQGGWASLAGLQADDIISKVDGQPVNNLKGFETMMKKLSTKKPASVVLFVVRETETLFVELRPTWPTAVSGSK